MTGRSRRRCRIHPILRVALALVLAGLVAAPLVQAAHQDQVRLTPASPSITLPPAGESVVTVTVRSSAVLPVSVRLVATAPPGWLHNWSAQAFDLAPGESRDVQITLFAPADGRDGDTGTYTLVARDTLGHDLGPSSSLAATIRAPAPAPTPSPSAPRLNVTANDASSPAGADAQGVVVIRNLDDVRRTVSLSITGKSAWAPRFEAQDATRTLDPRSAAGGRDIASVPVYATVPPGTPEGTRETFTVEARVGETLFRVPWTVTALAAPAPNAPSQKDAPASTENATAHDAAQPPPPASPTKAFTVAVEPPLFDIMPGGEATTSVRVQNTGNVALTVTLQAVAGDAWPVRFASATVDVPAGGSRAVPLTVTAPTGIPTDGRGLAAGSVVATSDGLVRNARFDVRPIPSDIAREDTQAAVVESPAPAGEPARFAPATIGLAAAVGAVGAGALALANRPLREKLLWAGIGLYTRLVRPDILGHEEREKLYHLIEAQPGIHFHALQRDLNWNTGTLTYHLRVLERHSFIASRRDGLYRRFYIVGAAPRKETFKNDQPQGLRADVLEAIRNQHGMSQADLALALGANKQTVNYHVKALERQGLIRLDKRGRETFLYPTTPGEGGQASAGA